MNWGKLVSLYALVIWSVNEGADSAGCLRLRGLNRIMLVKVLMQSKYTVSSD